MCKKTKIENRNRMNNERFFQMSRAESIDAQRYTTLSILIQQSNIDKYTIEICVFPTANIIIFVFNNVFFSFPFFSNIFFPFVVGCEETVDDIQITLRNKMNVKKYIDSFTIIHFGYCIFFLCFFPFFVVVAVGVIVAAFLFKETNYSINIQFEDIEKRVN